MIVTDKTTRCFKIAGLLQLIILSIIVFCISFFTIRYNLYKNYHNYAIILEENSALKREQQELKAEYIEYSKKIDKINEYLTTVSDTDNVNTSDSKKIKSVEAKNNNNNSQMTKKQISQLPKAEIIAMLDDKFQFAYSKLNNRKTFISQAVKKLGVSKISYNKRVKVVGVSEQQDQSSIVADVVDDKYIGGNDNVVRDIRVVKSEPFLNISERVIGKENFYKEINNLIVVENVVKSLPFGMPTDSPYRLTSTYGLRRDPFSNKKKSRADIMFHSGIDLVLEDDRILATKEGVVVFAGIKSGYGRCIDIEHMRKGGKGSIITHYAHLNDIYVKKGQLVKTGEVIGIQGNTGRSTGKHLHYEIRFNKKAINPNKFLKQDVVI